MVVVVCPIMLLIIKRRVSNLGRVGLVLAMYAFHSLFFSIDIIYLI